MKALNQNPFNPLHVSEILLSYKSKVKPKNRPSVSGSNDAYQIFRNFWDDNSLELREEFKAMLLNRSHRVLGIVTISTGGVSSTVVDPKMIFASALAANASSIIVAHNHPSGNLNPSKPDIHLTHKLANAGRFMELPIIDHLIITRESYMSFADKGLMS